MHRNPSFILSPAPRRLGLLRVLAFLLLAGGLLWSWTQAHAMSPPSAGSELASFNLLQADAEAVLDSAVTPGAEVVCRKPAPVKTTPVERVLNEVADLEVLPRQPVWMLAAQSVPMLGPQPALTQTEPQPLLRPPARLG
ncbi:MAG: hypothetical protein ABL896_17550 [Hylemonella sp.]